MTGTSAAPLDAPPLPGLFPQAGRQHDPLAEQARQAERKDEVLATLAAERAKPNPSELVIAAHEIWLRVYHEESQRLSATPTYITRSMPEGDA